MGWERNVSAVLVFVGALARTPQRLNNPTGKSIHLVRAATSKAVFLGALWKGQNLPKSRGGGGGSAFCFFLFLGAAEPMAFLPDGLGRRWSFFVGPMEPTPQEREKFRASCPSRGP